MARFQVFGFVLPRFLIAGCIRQDLAVLDSEGGGVRSDLAVETITVRLYEFYQGGETQVFPCDDDDGVTVDDPSIVAVTTLGEEEIRAVNGVKVDAKKFDLTGLKVGSVMLKGTCDGHVTTSNFQVR